MAPQHLPQLTKTAIEQIADLQGHLRSRSSKGPARLVVAAIVKPLNHQTNGTWISLAHPLFSSHPSKQIIRWLHKGIDQSPGRRRLESKSAGNGDSGTAGWHGSASIDPRRSRHRHGSERSPAE